MSNRFQRTEAEKLLKDAQDKRFYLAQEPLSEEVEIKKEDIWIVSDSSSNFASLHPKNGKLE